MAITHGILLAGGEGSRLSYYTSQLFNKHLIPLNNKFIIDYPLETLKNLGIKNLTIILGGNNFAQVVTHVKDGAHLGMTINYVYQSKPSGIAQAINLCEKFIPECEKFVVILGDNIFENTPVINDKMFSVNYKYGASIFLNKHHELNRFGVASIDYDTKEIVKIEEKPKELNLSFDNYAITGCYVFNRQFFDYFNMIQPSARGEYEITDIINYYLKENILEASFTSGLWSDAGTHESINYLNNYFWQKSNK